jgi:hypothetical protein
VELAGERTKNVAIEEEAACLCALLQDAGCRDLNGLMEGQGWDFHTIWKNGDFIDASRVSLNVSYYILET